MSPFIARFISTGVALAVMITSAHLMALATGIPRVEALVIVVLVNQALGKAPDRNE